MQKNNKLKFIDIFSGAGGMSCGLELAGLECILGIDFNEHAIKTFAKNHKHAKTYCGDVTKLTNAMLSKLISNEKVNLVVGGPPCQGFSTVGPGDPEDARNKLFLEFVRIVKHTAPEFVIIENVTGLLAKKNEKTLKAILKKFQDLGYKMDVQVLSAHHYGVPEKRRRTIFIGSKSSDKIIFPQKTHDIIIAKTFRAAKTIGESLNDICAKNGETYNHDIKSAQIKSKLDLKRIAKIPEGHGIRYEKDEKLFFKSKDLKLGINWQEIREGRLRQTKYQRLDRKGLAPTIMTHRHSYYHPVENRYLTQREAAKLQSFPNDFIFEGPLSAQWRQIGNAVPPLLAKALGLAIKKMETSINQSKHEVKDLAKTKQSAKNLKSKNTKKVNKNLKNTKGQKGHQKDHNEIEDIRTKAFVYRN